MYAIFFQATISSAMWPSSSHWAQVAEDYEIPYNGSTITYNEATRQQIGGNATDVSDMIEEFIQGNFIKVITLHLKKKICQFNPREMSYVFLDTIGHY